MAGSDRQILDAEVGTRVENAVERGAAEKAVSESSSVPTFPKSDQATTARQSRELAEQGKLGQLELADAADENDSDHVDVGRAIIWSPEKRENSRPNEGEGYHQVMERVGRDLLGRPLLIDELKVVVDAAKAVQLHRGKDPAELTTHDELLPKNDRELDIFLNALEASKPGPLSERRIQELSKNFFEVFHKQMTQPIEGALVYDTRPVKDQPVVTKVVPSAVYLDNSHIDGGQGFRRKENCETETQEYWLSKATAESLMRAQKWLVENGNQPIQLRNMNGAGRRALDRELIKKCAPNQPHAKRRSQHEDGISIDVDNYDDPKVREALTREGFVHNVPGDRPHFTWFGKKKN